MFLLHPFCWLPWRSAAHLLALHSCKQLIDSPQYDCLMPAGLDMAARSGKVELALLDALIDMKHSRPALQLRRIGRDGSSSFFDEVMSQDSIPANSG